MAETAGEKLRETGAGSKLEGAATTTGKVLEQGSEKTHEVLDKAGDKIKQAGPAVGKAVDKAGEKLQHCGTPSLNPAGAPAAISALPSREPGQAPAGERPRRRMPEPRSIVGGAAGVVR